MRVKAVSSIYVQECYLFRHFLWALPSLPGKIIKLCDGNWGFHFACSSLIDTYMSDICSQLETLLGFTRWIVNLICALVCGQLENVCGTSNRFTSWVIINRFCMFNVTNLIRDVIRGKLYLKGNICVSQSVCIINWALLGQFCPTLHKHKHFVNMD